MRLTETLTRAGELDQNLYDLQQENAALTEEIRQTTWQLRQCSPLQAEYAASFRGLLDRLTGKYRDKVEAMKKQKRDLQAELTLLQQKQEKLSLLLQTAEAERAALPEPEALKQAALQQEETAKLWAQAECRLCIRKLLPLLEKNDQALLRYRELLRGEIRMMTVEQQQEITAEPDIWAQQCSGLLERMQEPLEILGMPMEICSYYQSPIVFLMYAAAKYNRIDRASQAIGQMTKTRRQLTELQERLG